MNPNDLVLKEYDTAISRLESERDAIDCALEIIKSARDKFLETPRALPQVKTEPIHIDIREVPDESGDDQETFAEAKVLKRKRRTRNPEKDNLLEETRKLLLANGAMTLVDIIGRLQDLGVNFGSTDKPSAYLRKPLNTDKRFKASGRGQGAQWSLVGLQKPLPSTAVSSILIAGPEQRLIADAAHRLMVQEARPLSISHIIHQCQKEGIKLPATDPQIDILKILLKDGRFTKTTTGQYKLRTRS